jgi:oxysterol-binding protein 1
MQEAKETVNDKPPVSSQGMIGEEEKKEDIFLDAEEDLPKSINKYPIGEN